MNTIDKDKVNEIDEILSNLENHLHGTDGRSITEARKLLSSLSQSQPLPETEITKLEKQVAFYKKAGINLIEDKAVMSVTINKMREQNSELKQALAETEVQAIKFALWIGDNMYARMAQDVWFYGGTEFTTKQLYDKFTKEKNNI